VFETLACLGEVAFQKSQLQDWMAPTEAPVPRAFAATGHRGLVYRDPVDPTPTPATSIRPSSTR
jgi:aldehyde dehydrogenase (NAD+)